MTNGQSTVCQRTKALVNTAPPPTARRERRRCRIHRLQPNANCPCYRSKHGDLKQREANNNDNGRCESTCHPRAMRVDIANMAGRIATRPSAVTICTRARRNTMRDPWRRHRLTILPTASGTTKQGDSPFGSLSPNTTVTMNGPRPHL